MPPKRRKSRRVLSLAPPCPAAFRPRSQCGICLSPAYLIYYRKGPRRTGKSIRSGPVSGQFLREKGEDLLFLSRYLHLRQAEAVCRLLL